MNATVPNGNKRTVTVLLTISLSVFLSASSAIISTVYVSGQYAQQIEANVKAVEKISERGIIRDDKINLLSVSDERLGGALVNLNTQIIALQGTIAELKIEMRRTRVERQR